MRLPSAFQDITTIMEVPVETWRALFDAAREETRLVDGTLTHDRIHESLTNEANSSELIDALDALHELGTDRGRELLEEAADDQPLDLKIGPNESAREIAARVWIESRKSTPHAEVLVRARLHARETGPLRRTHEFAGKAPGRRCKFDREQLRVELAPLVASLMKSNVVAVYRTTHETETMFEILRGDPMKKVVVVKEDVRPEILSFRPAASDQIRYDAVTGRLGIATRSLRLLTAYREVFGKLLAGDHEFFAGENICTLKPLQERGNDLFLHHSVHEVSGVDVVELLWRRGDRDKVWVRSNDCFRVLKDLHARLKSGEGELIEARLRVTFAGGGRRGIVSIKVPNRIEYSDPRYQHAAEKLLDEVGIRGTFGDEDRPLRDLWSLHPWRHPAEEWRFHVGPDFERLVKAKVFLPTRLDAATHPDHVDAPGALDVHRLPDDQLVGISDDPAVSIRTLSPSDVDGLELDVQRVAKNVQRALELNGPVTEVEPGLLCIGSRELAAGISPTIHLALREPSPGGLAALRERCKGLAAVIVPPNRSLPDGIPFVGCRLPGGPFDRVWEQIVDRLGVRDRVPPHIWLAGRAEFVICTSRQAAWMNGKVVEGLRPGGHPFRFAVAVARASGGVVPKEALHKMLSATPDDQVVKHAKRDAQEALKAALKAAGLDPAAATKVFLPKDGGYAMGVSAVVVE